MFLVSFLHIKAVREDKVCVCVSGARVTEESASMPLRVSVTCACVDVRASPSCTLL